MWTHGKLACSSANVKFPPIEFCLKFHLIRCQSVWCRYMTSFFCFLFFFFQKKKKSPDARRLLKVPEELSSNYSVSWRRFACGTQNGGEWARGSRCVNDCDRSCHCWQREGGKKNKKKFNASKMSLKLLVLFQMISSPGFFSFSRKIYEA